MKIGVISRIIGVPPTGPKPILTYADSVPDEYDSLYMQDVDNPTPVLYSGSVKLGGAHYIYLKFNSDSAGTLYVTGHSDWDLVDPTTYEILLDQSVVDSGTAVNCIRFNGLTSGTWDSITIQVKALQGWYYTMSATLAVPEFTVIGYLLTTFPAAVGYSLSKIEENATKAVRVQRSGDDAQTDVGDTFLSGTTDLGWVNDDIDMDALLSWTQAGGSAPGAENCYVVTVYNQQNDGVSNNILPAALHTFTSTDVTKCPRLIANGTKCQTTIFGKTRPVLNTRKAVTSVTAGVSGSDGANASTDDGRQMFIDDPSLLTKNATFLRVCTLGYIPSMSRAAVPNAAPYGAYSRLFSLRTASYELMHARTGNGGPYNMRLGYYLATNPNTGSTSSTGIDFFPHSELTICQTLDGSLGEFNLRHDKITKADNVLVSTDTTLTNLSIEAPFDFPEDTLHVFVPGYSEQKSISGETYTAPYCWHTFVLYNDDTFLNNRDTIFNTLQN